MAQKLTEADRQIAQALVPLLATWPDEGMPAERLAAYVAVLGDLEPDLLRAAVAQCLSTCRFFPKPADIRGAAFDLRAKADALPSAFEAWEEVVHRIRTIGHGRLPEFSCPQVATAVRRVGGWDFLCLSENPVADRARFLEAYEDAERRQERDARMLPEVKALAARLSRPDAAQLPAPVDAAALGKRGEE